MPIASTTEPAAANPATAAGSNGTNGYVDTPWSERFAMRTEGLAISGVFDRRTEAAVKRYQTSRGLPGTGVVTD